MKVEREKITKDLMDEVEGVLKKHKSEIDPWGTELKIDKDIYIYGDVSGNYRGYAARDDNEKLIGYISYWIFPDPHNIEALEADQDIFYVDRDYRTSWIGIKLLKVSEEDLKSMEVKQILQQSLVSHPIDVIFKRLGYKETSVVFRKEV